MNNRPVDDIDYTKYGWVPPKQPASTGNDIDYRKYGWVQPESEKTVLDKISDNPVINSVLGAGDALQKTLSLGFLNPHSASGTAYDVGGIAGNILPYVAGEGLVAKGLGKIAPKIPALLNRILASGVTTGGMAAAETPGDRLKAGLIGAGVGSGFGLAGGLASRLSPVLGAPVRAGLGGLAGYELGGKTGAGIGATAGLAAPYLIPSLSRKLGERAALEGVDLAKAQPRLDASERLGLSYLTPAEATGSPFVAGNQGAVGRTGEGSQLAYEKGQERLASERGSISRLLDSVYNQGIDDPRVKKLYEDSYRSSLAPDLVENAKNSSSIIKSAFDKVGKDPAYQDKLKGIPENNYAYLDQVKRAMDDMRQSALRGGEKDKARLVKEQLNAMKDLMDYYNPDYKAARELSERGIARSNIEKKMNDAEITGTNFYNKFLKNDNQFGKLRFSLRNVPGAQEKLDDMRLVFKDLINPRTVKTAFGKAEHGMPQNRNTLDAVQDLINNLNGRRYDRAFIELISNPEWDKEFSRVMKTSDKGERMALFANILSKASAHGISNALSQNGQFNMGDGA